MKPIAVAKRKKKKQKASDSILLNLVVISYKYIKSIKKTKKDMFFRMLLISHFILFSRFAFYMYS